MPYLNRIIDEHRIDWIYPAHDSVLLALAEQREKLHCPVIAPATKTVQICRDKNKTYDFFNGQWYITNYYKSADEVPHYPVFIKPTIGQGATDARRIDDRAHLEEAIASGTEYAICEFLPGNEYTIDCFTDKDRKLIFANFRMRDVITSGIAVQSHPMPVDEEVRRIAEDINEKLEFKGSWFFQLKKNTRGEYKLLEIAPRIAGTTTVTRNLGVNLEMLTVFTFCGYDVEILNNGNKEVMSRSFGCCFKTDIVYDTVYLNFEDTLIVHGKVNAELIRFLYQAREKGKKILLFKPQTVELDDYCISERLFEKILDDSFETKAMCVTSDGIYIDESFRARKYFHEKGVAVFELSMVESLIDHRM
ncbi:MAG: ATP-grasp domain-containing protein [Eubacteriales bacterium]|nr:ATP-grasp domain-containing protein [Eubacteriales bacterium]